MSSSRKPPVSTNTIVLYLAIASQSRPTHLIPRFSYVLRDFPSVHGNFVRDKVHPQPQGIDLARMRFLFVFWVQFLIFSSASASQHLPRLPLPNVKPPGQQFTTSSTAGTDALAATGLRNLQAYSQQQLDSDCNQSNLAVRREW